VTPQHRTDPDQNPITLLGVPYDTHSSFARGAAEAPPLIRAALSCDSSNRFAEDGTDTVKLLIDGGDLTLNDATARETISDAVESRARAGERLLLLGGDHAVTYPIVRGLARVMGPLDIFHIDAHPDLYDELDGDRFSHGCPFARIMEGGHARRLVQVGIRTLNDHQRAQAERFGVEVCEMRDPPARLSFDRPVYVSIDLDGLDPAFVPGVSHPEPGGLSTREVISLLHGLEVPIIGADVVEYNPRFDCRDLTARVAAKLVKELAAIMGRTA